MGLWRREKKEVVLLDAIRYCTLDRKLTTTAQGYKTCPWRCSTFVAVQFWISSLYFVARKRKKEHVRFKIRGTVKCLLRSYGWRLITITGIYCMRSRQLRRRNFPNIKCYIKWNFNTFTAIVGLSRFNNSCLKSPASTLVNLTFQSRSLRSFSLNQLRNLSL